MPRVLIASSFPTAYILRQTPGRLGRWDEFEFCSDPLQGPYDACVVYDDLVQPLSTDCQVSNTLLITGEPESLRRYRSRFTGQFAHVWTSHTSIHHPSVTRRNEAQHWHYALRPGQTHGQDLGFDELVSMKCPQKSKLLSVICSNKAHTEDHRKRLEFVQLLQRELGEQIDVFGRGIRDIDDKSDAIFNYKYHIVLENDHSPNFMTEKLGDAFLGWSYPIYFGGPEAYHRFPTGSFTAIDIYEQDEALNIIRNVLSANTYESNLDAIAEARHRVLHQNNICSMLADFWKDRLSNSPVGRIDLLPKRHRASLVMRQVRRAIKRPVGRWMEKPRAA